MWTSLALAGLIPAAVVLFVLWLVPSNQFLLLPDTPHLAANVVNLFIMETVRRNYLEEHNGIVTADLLPKDGQLPLPPGPGLGIDLDEDVAYQHRKPGEPFFE